MREPSVGCRSDLRGGKRAAKQCANKCAELIFAPTESPKVLAGQEWSYTVDAFVDADCNTRMFPGYVLEPKSAILDGKTCHLPPVSELPVIFECSSEGAIVEKSFDDDECTIATTKKDDPNHEIKEGICDAFPTEDGTIAYVKVSTLSGGCPKPNKQD